MKYTGKRILKIFFLILVVLAVAITAVYLIFLKPGKPPISMEDRQAISIMPLPQKLVLNDDYFNIDKDFGFEFKDYEDGRLKSATMRFLDHLSKITGLNFNGNNNSSLIIDCEKGSGEFPGIVENESYILNIKRNSISLSATSSIGVVRGLETLLQMVEKKEAKWIIRTAEMKDKPRFPWRGLMIDVCRHWIPKYVILRQIDAMSAVKLNVLHLHLSDHQAFRVESKVFPLLHKLGSKGNYYTQRDIHEIIDYAACRGIRIIPEFDLPGHSVSWLVGYPELASKPGSYKLVENFNLIEPVMNPANEEVYDFLDRFFQEMATLFPDEYLHIGGDEVNPKHWKENDQIQIFMKENGIENTHQLQAYFNRRISEILKKHGKKMIGWDEILNPSLPKEDIIIQSWRSQENLFNAARRGYKAILSSGLYLDHKLHSEKHYNIDPLILKGGITVKPDTTNWKSWNINIKMQDADMNGSMFLFGDNNNLRGFFEFMGKTNSFEKATLDNNKLTFSFESDFGEINVDAKINEDSISGTMGLSIIKLDMYGNRSGGSDMPEGIELPELRQIKPLTNEQKSNILGGEACMWAELVDSITIESRIWPRTAAIAEKLWSPANLTENVDDMYRRLKQTDRYLVKRGLKYYQNQNKILKNLVSNGDIGPLKTLVNLLEEDKYYNRMSLYGEELSVKTPLNRTVDASFPESFAAYDLSKNVKKWLNDPENKEAKKYLKERLSNWSTNHKKLLPVIQQSKQLKEIKEHSEYFSKVSKIGLTILDKSEKGGKLTGKEKQKYLDLLEEAAVPKAGMLLQIVTPVKMMVENYK